MTVHTLTPPVGHGHRDPIVAGARRVLQDRRTTVTVKSIGDDLVHWWGDDGSHGDTSRRIFTALTTPADGPEAA